MGLAVDVDCLVVPFCGCRCLWRFKKKHSLPHGSLIVRLLNIEPNKITLRKTKKKERVWRLRAALRSSVSLAAFTKAASESSQL